MTMKTQYDLCLTWNWKHDADFVRVVDKTCKAHGMSLLQITPHNLDEMLQFLGDGQIVYRVFFDRASDEDARFIPFEQWAHDHAVHRINPRERAVRAWNKAAMHLALIDAGLNTPHTIILPSYEEQPELPPIDLSPLGDNFVIKPAHGGGGEGVIKGASSLKQALIARQEYPADKYLLQANVIPTRLGSRPAWFRVFSCLEKIYPCWWSTDTHAYNPVTVTEECHYGLSALRQITTVIARICGLGLFSTEIALTQEGLWIVVDYVNDQIDLRLQSQTPDGVPDDIARNFAESLTALADVRSSFQREIRG